MVCYGPSGVFKQKLLQTLFCSPGSGPATPSGGSATWNYAPNTFDMFGQPTTKSTNVFMVTNGVDWLTLGWTGGLPPPRQTVGEGQHGQRLMAGCVLGGQGGVQQPEKSLHLGAGVSRRAENK